MGSPVAMWDASTMLATPVKGVDASEGCIRSVGSMGVPVVLLLGRPAGLPIRNPCIVISMSWDALTVTVSLTVWSIARLISVTSKS